MDRLIIYQIEFDKIKWSCPWNSHQNCMQNSTKGCQGLRGCLGWWGQGVGGLEVVWVKGEVQGWWGSRGGGGSGVKGVRSRGSSGQGGGGMVVVGVKGMEESGVVGVNAFLPL